MNNIARGNRSLVHFVVLITFGVVVTMFLVYKANQVVAELDTLKSVYTDFQ